MISTGLELHDFLSLKNVNVPVLQIRIRNTEFSLADVFSPTMRLIIFRPNNSVKPGLVPMLQIPKRTITGKLLLLK